MRKVLFFAWLLVPVGAMAYHFGPGQDRMKLDRADDCAQRAGTAMEQQKWSEAVKSFDEALTLLPASHDNQARALRLERAKAQMQIGQLPEARADLESLVTELAADKQADPAILADARSTLATSQYYMTWLMRLEGLPRADWEPEIDAARQTYKLLAEQATAAGTNDAAQRYSEDVESAIRLARMELKDLQAAAIPKQCSGCCSGQCKKPGNKPVRKKGQKKNDARGASMGNPPDDSGN